MDAYTVAVAVDVMRSQVYALAVVSLPDAVQESRDRALRALENSGFTFPARRITINLTVSGEVAVVVTSR